VPPASILDKPAYSAFAGSGLAAMLLQKDIRAVIITGSETDVCVLSSVLSAIDHGFRVIVAEDGLCSSSDAGHDALMTLYRTRFTEQIELMTIEEVCALWRDEA
jgi:nicotinamidase-related amidase